MPKRTAEEVCIEYARVAGLIRAESSQISPWKCERAAVSEFRPGRPGGTTPIEPCISTLFDTKHTPGPGAYEEHQNWQEDFEEEMCDPCKETLKHVRARRELRLKMGAAKRAITAVGKRLEKERAACPST